MNPSQSTWASAGVGVPAAMLIAWALSLVHVVMPPEISTALGALIAAAVGYFGDGGQAAHTIQGAAAMAASSPTPKQGGFARPALLCLIALAGFPMLAALPACTSTAAKPMDPTGNLALETTVRIAVRHAVEGSPRAAEKAAHIRSIVATLRSVTTAESTVAALETVVRTEVDKLNLSPLDKADANDLITLLGVALESRFQGADASKLVAVNEFLQLVLSALPATA